MTELEAFFAAQGASVTHVEMAAARNASDSIEALKAVLPFPDWCGSGWDSMEDAFEELRQAWSFPLVLIIKGLPTLVTPSPQLAFQIVVRLSDFVRAFSLAGDHLVVVYVW